MREKPSYNDYYRDILNSAKDAVEFMGQKSFEDFLKDRKTQMAVERCLEIIGEAVRSIPLSERKRQPLVPWGKIRGMRRKKSMSISESI